MSANGRVVCYSGSTVDGSSLLDGRISTAGRSITGSTVSLATDAYIGGRVSMVTSVAVQAPCPVSVDGLFIDDLSVK